MKNIIKTLMAVFIFVILNTTTYAIDLITTPLKYELEVNPGESITKTAKIINREETDLYISIGKSNVIVENGTGKPIFVDVGNLNQELASWIYLKESSFLLPALGEYTIEFDVNVPSNATPGGHYGVVYFNYDPKLNSIGNSSGGGVVNIKANYGVLILVEVAGEIVEGGGPSKGGTIVGGGGVIGTDNEEKNLFEDEIDKCPYGDFSSSNVDGLCFDAVLKEKVEEFVDKIKNKDKNTENFPLDYEKEIDVKPEDFPLNSAKEIEEEEIEEDFGVDFSVPFENNGNTHIKPNGKITLYDENDKVIEQVGTENILNENGVIIGQKIVDYLPINEELGNVLPNSQRVFYQTWKGFPYETHDESGKVIIKYWSPSEYYSKKSKVSVTTIYPWQRIKTKLEFKKIKSITHLSYEKNNGELEEFNLTKDFFIKYKYEYIGYNPYFFIYLAIFLIVIWFFWFIILLIRKKKCPYCGKRIDKNLKICPYCGLTVEKF